MKSKIFLLALFIHAMVLGAEDSGQDMQGQFAAAGEACQQAQTQQDEQIHELMAAGLIFPPAMLLAIIMKFQAATSGECKQMGDAGQAALASLQDQSSQTTSSTSSTSSSTTATSETSQSYSSSPFAMMPPPAPAPQGPGAPFGMTPFYHPEIINTANY